MISAEQERRASRPTRQFDLLFISQVLTENMPICTSDHHFAAYGIEQVW